MKTFSFYLYHALNIEGVLRSVEKVLYPVTVNIFFLRVNGNYSFLITCEEKNLQLLYPILLYGFLRTRYRTQYLEIISSKDVFSTLLFYIFKIEFFKNGIGSNTCHFSGLLKVFFFLSFTKKIICNYCI